MSRAPDRRRAIARLVLLGLLIAAAFAAVTLRGASPGDVQRWILEAGAIGPLVFVVAGAALGLALFPGQVIATAAGAIFGALAGIPVALLAAVVAAGLAMLLGRRIGADALLALLTPRAREWQAWIAHHGFSAVLVSRLAPGVPSGIVNYLAGVAGIRTRALLAAVVLGALPKTTAYVALGGALSDPWSVRGAIAIALYAGAAVGGLLVARRLAASRPVAAQPAAV